jgi:hypothetical protein
MADQTISISECRNLRAIINSMTAACFLTEKEYLQIMLILASVGERLEAEGRVSKE